ncbi:MAG: EAL domain-containing protein [Acidovorax sp.]|uniref:bifunctional diguanylate cyclase/phosphodiesterase n=1 Tax=Acidovorax sp. TaxID=1872122 RepID=UPI0039E3AA80
MADDLHHPERRWHWLTGLGVAALGVALSLWLACQQADAVEQTDRARFAQEARAFADALAQRIDGHTEVVYGLRGLFTANPHLSRAEFDQAASEMEPGRRYPGLRNLSFTRWVPRAQRAEYEARVRADTSLSLHGYPDFAIHPPGDRDEYFVAEYLWPMTGNESVLGLDISVQPTNLAAMHYSRETGEAVMSAPFDLLQEQDHRPGFVIRVPVYDHAAGTALPRFIGAVACTIRVYDLVRALMNQGLLGGVALSMDDRGSTRPGATDDTVRPLLALTAEPLPGAQPLVRDLVVHDRRWRLTFHPTQSFLSPSEAREPALVRWTGVLLSLLLGTTVGLLWRQRAQALARAHASDAARRESDKRFDALFNQTAVGVSQVEMTQGRLVRVNQRYCDIVGYTADELLAMDFQTLTHPEDLEPNLASMERLRAGEVAEFRMEKRYRHKDGRMIWIDLTVVPLWAPGASQGFQIAVVQDITERKRMEDTLRTSEHRLRGILERLPVGACLVRRDGHIDFRNRRYVEICGYTDADAPDVDTWWRRAFPDKAERKAVLRSWQAEMRRAKAAGGVIASAEYTILCGNGTKKPVEVSGVEMEDGHLITMVDLSQRKQAEDEIRYLAFYDPLTRLPNRRLLVDRLQQALAASARHQRSGALLMLDLDNFKTLNETQGHDKGDRLLLQVAHRLRASVHEDDTVARQGGDEFVVVLEDMGDSPEDAAARTEEAAQRILAALREPYTLDGEVHHSSLSMGIALFSGMRETAEELLKRADLAMYQAKSAGRDTLRFYDPQMQAAVSARAALELDMRAGLAQGQFELYYQPQVERGCITGAEALLRWRHPRDGFVSPAHFIPLAEETGLILPLGEWVLRAACEQLARWAQDPLLGRLSLAVNVSPRQFHQSGFVAQVLAALAVTGADGRSLKLELTEGLLLADVEDTIQKMGQLRGYGVGFSLDDFGTGYSSLAYLKRLPLDQLKIDQSFVRDVLTDPNDAAIARTVVALGTSLGLRVIAEGVETEAQREFLERHQCHAWQGYLFSPPVPAAEFEELVRGHPP